MQQGGLRGACQVYYRLRVDPPAQVMYPVLGILEAVLEKAIL
jgi:hypothetical protein